MDFLNSGITVGHYWGITVRLHFTFILFALFRATSFGHLGYGIAFVAGLYLCILLHEFGHALAARWCDGEANEILLWPLGGLAYCRPAFHPTAHLITTVAGPFVTFLLWLFFWGLQAILNSLAQTSAPPPLYLYWFVDTMRFWNLLLLVFNLIPAFPMDGGRIVRDTLWHFLSAEKATKIAVNLSRVIAIVGIAYALMRADYWLVFLAAFILIQTIHEKHIVGFEARGTYEFSIRERLKRGVRRRAFHRAVTEIARQEESEPFHRCATCGRTEDDSHKLEFRVCTDCANGEEYCQDHLHTHRHTRPLAKDREVR